MNTKDYYKILEVEANAEAKQIKDAYRKLAFKYHPDRNTDNLDAAEQMKAVNEAYAVLSDVKKRNEYDMLRGRFGDSAYGQFRQTYSEQDIFNGSDIQQIFEEMAKAFDLRGFEAMFKEFYGPNHQGFEFKADSNNFFFFGGFGAKKNGSASFKSRVIEKLSRHLIGKVLGGVIPQKGADVNDDIYIDLEFARTGGPFAYFYKKKGKKINRKSTAGRT